MLNTHMKRCSTSLVMTELQDHNENDFIVTNCTNIQIWHCQILVRIWISGYSYTAVGNINRFNHFGKEFGTFMSC